MKCLRFTAYAITSFLLLACSAPRTIKDSGKVTQKGDFKAGVQYSANISTNTIGRAYTNLSDEIEDFSQPESEEKVYEQKYDGYTKTLVAYSLDPLSIGSEIYLRYGVLKDWEVGLSYGSGLGFQLGYQLFDESTIDGALSLEYSSQEYSLPGKFGDFQEFIGFEFNRKDVLSHFRMSKSLGENERFGYVGYGLSLVYSQIEYGLSSSGVDYIDIDNEIIQLGKGDSFGYFSYGTYLNTKLGYEWVFVLLGANLYYQDYGEIQLPLGEKASMDGLTIIPSIGLQLSF